jgi:hypothetical protein
VRIDRAARAGDVDGLDRVRVKPSDPGLAPNDVGTSDQPPGSGGTFGRSASRYTGRGLPSNPSTSARSPIGSGRVIRKGAWELSPGQPRPLGEPSTTSTVTTSVYVAVPACGCQTPWRKRGQAATT